MKILILVFILIMLFNNNDKPATPFYVEDNQEDLIEYYMDKYSEDNLTSNDKDKDVEKKDVEKKDGEKLPKLNPIY